MTLEERLKKWTEITGINPQEDKGSYTILMAAYRITTSRK